MAIMQVAALLLASFAICLAYPSANPDTTRLHAASYVPEDVNTGTSITRGKRGYLSTTIAYPPLLTSAIAPAVPVVTPVVTSYSYFGHYGKPAIYPPIYPHGYHGFTYYG